MSKEKKIKISQIKKFFLFFFFEKLKKKKRKMEKHLLQNNILNSFLNENIQIQVL